MTKKGIFLIIACAVLLCGIAVSGAALWYTDFDFTSLDDISKREILESSAVINYINIDSENAVVNIMPSVGNNCIVEYVGADKDICSASVSTGNLMVTQKNAPESWGFAAPRFSEVRIDIYIPDSYYELFNVKSKSGSVSVYDGFSCRKTHIETESGSVNISFSDSDSGTVEISAESGSVTARGIRDCESVCLKTESGRIDIADIYTDYLRVETESGRQELSDIHAVRTDIASESGSVSLKNAVSQAFLNISTKSGAVSLNGADSSEINIETVSGRVEGSLISPKIFDVKSSSGKITVPKSQGRSLCNIRTLSGSVNIEIR